ncbi:hypothetical protein RQP46_009815 [Phenoliferia psychrophenolica]
MPGQQSKPPKALKLAPSTSGRPNYLTDVRAWPRSTVIRCAPQYLHEYLPQLEEHQIQNRRSKKQNTLRLNLKITGMIRTADGAWEGRWRAMTQKEREGVVLEGLSRATDVVRDESDKRSNVPEITLSKMCADGGAGWWRLVEHFILDSPDATEFKILRNATWEKQMYLDRVGDGIPLHRALRATQEEGLYNRHLFILYFLLGCLNYMNGETFDFIRTRNPEGAGASDLVRLSLNGDAQKIADYIHVEKDTVKVCAGCDRPKHLIPHLVASGKSFQHCAKCFKLGRSILYCGRDCQVSDFPTHKRVCGRKLADLTDVPISLTPRPTPPTLSAGIKRQLDELPFSKNASWFAFYGSPSTCQRRHLVVLDPTTRAKFEAVRDKAIKDRDAESVAVIMHCLYGLVDGVKVTRAGVERQTVEEFGISLATLRGTGMDAARLEAIGLNLFSLGMIH